MRFPIISRWALRHGAVIAFVGVMGVGAVACTDEHAVPRVSLPPTTAAEPTEPLDVAQPAVPDDPSEVIVVPAGSDLGALAEAAPPGATFMLASGVHRGHRIVPKDGMTFRGASGAIMTGAAVLTGFVADEDFWRLDGVEPSARDHGECIVSYQECARTQDLFMDDVMLWQVGKFDDLGPGRWFWEGAEVWVADDPAHRRVELSTVPYAFVGSADDVTISSLVVTKYATPAQEGAIQSQEPGEGERGRGWTLESVEVTGVHGAAVRAGDDTTIRGSYLHHNGQLGVTGAGGTGLLIEDSEIAHNNISGFRWEWEAGGVKVTNSDDVTFRTNHVHNNLGPGLWADLDTVDTRYEHNLVTDNGGPGIFHEISGAAVITGNDVLRNGYDKTEWLWGAGILIAASWDVEVLGNTVIGNANAISGVQQDRGTGPYGPRLLRDVQVHDNVIVPGDGYVGVVEDVGDDSVFVDRNIRFSNNTYVGVRGRIYRWIDRALNRELWVRAGQDVEGTWIDELPEP